MVQPRHHLLCKFIPLEHGWASFENSASSFLPACSSPYCSLVATGDIILDRTGSARQIRNDKTALYSDWHNFIPSLTETETHFSASFYASQHVKENTAPRQDRGKGERQLKLPGTRCYLSALPFNAYGQIFYNTEEMWVRPFSFK